jgi:septum formation protein
VILASGSSIRSELLRRWGLAHRVAPVPDHVEEAVPEPASPAPVAAAVDFAVVVAADTIGLVDGRLLQKPGDEREVRSMLSALSGRRHSVITGLCLLRDRREAAGGEESVLELEPLDPSAIEEYARSGEGLGKCGAIAIEGRLRDRFRLRSGSRSNVLGLPLGLLRALARSLGVELPPPPAAIEEAGGMRAA